MTGNSTETKKDEIMSEDELRAIVSELMVEGFDAGQAMGMARSILERRGQKNPAQQTQLAHVSQDPRYPVSAQNLPPGRLAVNYGHESPDQAKERWIRQEMEDPNGVYSMGGMTAGGVFGSAAVSTETYDPSAHHRGAPAMQAEAMRVQTLVNVELLKALQGMQQGQAPGHSLPPRHSEPPSQFDDGRGRRRRLGKKK